MNKMTLILEGKHWPEDYIKTAYNTIKNSSLGKQSWYSDAYIQQDIKTFADEFSPLSHKNSNLGFFATIVRWFIEYSENSAQKYQEFIERKLDGIIGTLQTILNDPSYDKIKDEIKQKWTFEQFEELQKKIADEAKASSDEKLRNIVKRDDYDLIPIYSYEELHEKFGGDWTGYKGQSEWCHTNGKSTYESWTKNGTQMFFVLAKKDWQKVFQPEEKPTGKDYNAYDNYGLSLIAILVDVATGNLLNETLRWNHVIEPSYTNPGASVDKAFKNNWGDLSQAVGMDVKSKVENFIKDQQNNIKNKQDAANEEVAKILKNAKIITNVTIPKEIRKLITKVDIPDSIESIGSHAFFDCINLTSVTIPDSVMNIGDYAFYSCSGLESITILDSVTSIGIFAFSNCVSLSSITIGNGVTSIGNNAFYDCIRLTSITIGNGVTSIGRGAFDSCYELTNVTIPDSVTDIGLEAFSYCINLTSVTIGNSVTNIGQEAFDGCSRLKNVTIPNSVTSIGGGAFYASGLTSMTIPASVTSMGEWVFKKCNSLVSITFKGKTIDQVKAMENYPFGIKDESIIKAEDAINESKHNRQIYFWAHMLDEAFNKTN